MDVDQHYLLLSTFFKRAKSLALSIITDDPLPSVAIGLCKKNVYTTLSKRQAKNGPRFISTVICKKSLPKRKAVGLSEHFYYCTASTCCVLLVVSKAHVARAMR